MGRFLFLIIVGLGGVAILAALGIWQVQRLAWKKALLAEIEIRIDAPPVALPTNPDPDADRYLPVAVAGIFDNAAIRILASRRHTGAVYRIIRPMTLAEGRRILVDTGWIEDDASLRPPPETPVQLTGNLHWPRESDAFTPEPDEGANIWFARDVPRMARALGTEAILVVLRDAPDDDLGVTFWSVDTEGIPNDHLQYAITWFSLACVWAGMTAIFLLRARRGAQTTQG